MAYKSFIVSFEIASRNVGSDSYSDRYDSLMDAIKKFGLRWTETTSFASIHADETLGSMSTKLFVGTKINSAHDKLLIVEMKTGNAKYSGPKGTEPGKYHFNLV